MIEIIVRNYLLSQNLSVGQNIFLETPQEPPEEYILIEKTGGGRTNHINKAMMAVKSISRRSMYRAAAINEEVVAVMEGIIYAADVFSCELNSDYNFTNTTTKEHRYQAVFNLFY